MDKKFIDAEMLISELDASCMPIFEKGISGCLGDTESIADVIRSQPAADVQEVRHGYWKHCGDNRDLRDNLYDCSVCGRMINIICGDSIVNYPYCHCGARMDGDTNA